jgi:YebC/PmpR family DNA-binding regulatory protein
MSGHSHWATIKRKKDVADAKKGKVFSRYAKMIMTAAREGGSELSSNYKLAFAVEQARAGNMPKDNIERAIKKGAGELEGGSQMAEQIYEAYGPGGVAILIESVTDNKNRTTGEIRNMLESVGGHLGSTGSVNWMFEKRGLFVIDKHQATEEKLTEVALDAGAEDLATVGDTFQVVCMPTDFAAVRKALDAAKIPVRSAQLAFIPKSSVPVSEEIGRRLMGLLERLEDQDDVQAVHVNMDLPESLLAEASA